MPLFRIGTLLLSAALVGIGSWLAFLTIEADHLPVCTPLSPVMDTSQSPQEQSFQQILDRYSEQHGGIGLQATILFKDGAHWQGRSGYASLEKRCPLTAVHRLYLGSMTKLFTAALILHEVETGRVQLDQPVHKWVSLPGSQRITLRMLLNHTSGIPSYTSDLWFLLRYLGLPHKQWQPAELMAVVQNNTLLFEPGTHHAYSNSNYLLLGIILEKATGKPYAQLLYEVIVDPLALTHTTFQTPADSVAISNGYDVSLLHLGRRNLTGLRQSLESGAYSAGGILSTSEDTARFTQLLFTGQILDPTSLKEMLTFVKAPDPDLPDQQGYGLGVRNLLIDGQNWVGHTGSIPGYSGFVMHHLEQGWTIAVISNVSTIQQTALLGQLQKALQP